MKDKQNRTAAEREAGKIIRGAKTVTAFEIIFSALPVAAVIVSFFDKSTPAAVYYFAALVSTAFAIIFSVARAEFVCKIRAKSGDAGERIAKKQDIKSLKNKTYRILTGIALFGDGLCASGVIFLASGANVSAAVTVISIISGALILTVFHAAALIYLFKRKSAAERNMKLFSHGHIIQGE